MKPHSQQGLKMAKKADKEKLKEKAKHRKLKLNKKTVKDLDANEPSSVKGWAPAFSSTMHRSDLGR